MTAPIWYELLPNADHACPRVNLAYAISVQIYCPAQWGTGRNVDDHTFVEVRWPTNDRYGKATQIIFAGNYGEARDELDRITAILDREAVVAS